MNTLRLTGLLTAAMIGFAPGSALAAPPSTISVLDGRPTTEDRQPVHIDRSTLAGIGVGDRVILELLTDRVASGAVTARRARSDDRFTLAGDLDDGAGTFLLAVNRDAVAGFVDLRQHGAYRIEAGDSGGHVVVPIDAGAFVCSVPDDASLDANDIHAGGGAVAGTCDDGSVIDMLVVYTQGAHNAAGGIAAIEAEVDLMVEYNNICYANSEINTTLNLVYVWQLGAGENPSLGQLTDPDDGVVDEVHTLRDVYGADQVALIYDGAGGVANGLWNLDPESEALAFCANGRESGPVVLPHEIGHNMGCCHAPGDGGGCPAEGGLLFSYSNGHRWFGDSGTQWRTTMAYSPGTYVQHFSNPDINVDGQPTGVPIGESGEAHNAQTINLSAFTVSNWRCNDGICEGLDLPSDAPDCNDNGVPDPCDIARGDSSDANSNGVPDECEGCLWDLDGNSSVGFSDLLVLLSAWDDPYTFGELLNLLASWGPC